LTIITIGINNRENQPQISYVNALEFYSLICFTFVLLSFAQFMMVNWFYVEHDSNKLFTTSTKRRNMNSSYKVAWLIT